MGKKCIYFLSPQQTDLLPLFDGLEAHVISELERSWSDEDFCDLEVS